MTDPSIHGTLAESAVDRLCKEAHELKCQQTETHDEIRRLRREIDDEESAVGRMKQRIASKKEEIDRLQEALEERRAKYLSSVAVFGDTLYGTVRSTR